ncbi:MAG: hypothetical protein IT556_07010 [Acetobacteraceae bacterium]|nr:hypothetical protein [Acetobacteraceae bacterium]
MSISSRHVFTSAGIGALLLAPALALAQGTAPAAKPSAATPPAAAAHATTPPAAATPAATHAATPAAAAAAARPAHHAARVEHAAAHMRSANAELGYAAGDLRQDRMISARVALERAETAVLNDRAAAEGDAAMASRASALSGVIDHIMAARTAISRGDRGAAEHATDQAQQALKTVPAAA